ncbi:MAG: hypothetical protein LUF87_11365 [Alistipes sp.]|nr:hypothetical protein [Alistipes sp.]
MRSLLLVFILWSAVSCGNGRNGRAMETVARQYAHAGKPDTGAICPDDGETVQAVFAKGRARNLIHKRRSQTVYVTFESEKGKTLHGRLMSKDTASNIRIFQITLPDGTMDGPFSMDITYRLPETGTYRLAIHENMMAGEPWEGDFKIELALK